MNSGVQFVNSKLDFMKRFILGELKKFQNLGSCFERVEGGDLVFEAGDVSFDRNLDYFKAIRHVKLLSQGEIKSVDFVESLEGYVAGRFIKSYLALPNLGFAIAEMVLENKDIYFGLVDKEDFSPKVVGLYTNSKTNEKTLLTEAGFMMYSEQSMVKSVKTVTEIKEYFGDLYSYGRISQIEKQLLSVDYYDTSSVKNIDLLSGLVVMDKGLESYTVSIAESREDGNLELFLEITDKKSNEVYGNLTVQELVNVVSLFKAEKKFVYPLSALMRREDFFANGIKEQEIVYIDTNLITSSTKYYQVINNKLVLIEGFELKYGIANQAGTEYNFNSISDLSREISRAVTSRWRGPMVFIEFPDGSFYGKSTSSIGGSLRDEIPSVVNSVLELSE